MNIILASTTINLIEYWILILLIQYVCSAHMNLTYRNMGIASCISLFTTVINYLCFENAFTFTAMFVAIVLTILLFSQRKFSDILRFFPAIALYFILTVVPQAMLKELIPATHTLFIIEDTNVTLVYVITDLVLLIFLIILRHFLIKYETTMHFRAKEILGSVALMFFAFIDVALIMFLNESNVSPVLYYIYLTLYVGAFICSVVYYFYNLFESRIRIYHQSVARNEIQYLQLQLDALQDVKENEEHVKRMRHDLTNHLGIIKALCEEGNYQEVVKYTEALSNDVTFSNSKILTENKVADLVVGSKAKICDESGITFTFTGTLKNLGCMTAPDICGLLANAYDNAIEACRNQSGAYIHTKVSTTRNYTVMQIVNSVDKKVSIRNNSISTTKKDKKAHGYGIDIMKRIARKYNGKCTLHCDEKEFTVKITVLT